MTLPAHSTTVTESLSENDSECDGEEEDDVSDNVLEILGEQSGTPDETNSTDTASGGTCRTEAPAKKTTINLTEVEERFVKKFQPVVSKIDKPWKIVVRHVSVRGVSMKKQGTRKHDVKV